MVSKNTIKLINSLSHKKYRIKENLFVVEGDKNVTEVLLSEFKTEMLFVTDKFLSRNKNIVKNAGLVTETTQQEINQISLLKSPQNSIAVCKLPQPVSLPSILKNGLYIYLDDIQDPGNLGTIVRICDWFGIEHLFCSPKTADLFNPKVIQASMGSFCRVKVGYFPFEPVAQLAAKSGVPVFGAFLDGNNIYQEKLPNDAVIVLGNEGNGISSEIENMVTQKIKIPEFSINRKSAESLNVSVATAIICSEFKRQSSFLSYSK